MIHQIDVLETNEDSCIVLQALKGIQAKTELEHAKEHKWRKCTASMESGKRCGSFNA